MPQVAPCVASHPNPASSPPLRRTRWLLALERFFPPLAPAFVAHADRVDTTAGKPMPEEPAYVYRRALAELGSFRGLDILDVGCGYRHPARWLEAQGVGHVQGVDVDAQAIAFQKQQQETLGLTRCHYQVSCPDGLPLEEVSCDVAISFNVFEHVMDLPGMFAELHRVLRPGGTLFVRCSPLFYSPYGHHLTWASHVPFAHLLFGFKPMKALRELKRGPLHCADWRQTGLNMMTFEDFREAAKNAGFEAIRLERVAVRRLTWLACLPGVGRYFTLGIDAALRRSHGPGAGPQG